jgi:hypothetical protein
MSVFEIYFSEIIFIDQNTISKETNKTIKNKVARIPAAEFRYK